MGVEFQFDEMKKVLEMNDGECCSIQMDNIPLRCCLRPDDVAVDTPAGTDRVPLAVSSPQVSSEEPSPVRDVSSLGHHQVPCNT